MAGVVLVLLGEGGWAGAVLVLLGGGWAGIVLVLLGKGVCSGGGPCCNEGLLLLGVRGSGESLFIPGDASGFVRDLFILIPNRRRSPLDPLALDVRDDEDSTRRKSEVSAEGAEESGAV
jgi:hypothetical protein